MGEGEQLQWEAPEERIRLSWFPPHGPVVTRQNECKRERLPLAPNLVRK